MTNNDIDKAYISPYDRFLHEFDMTHPKSASQLQEIKKFEQLFAIRDGVVVKEGQVEDDAGVGLL